MKEKAVQGFFWSFYENVGIKLFSTATYFLLAGLLAPSDFGLVAILNSFLFFAGLFTGKGSVTAIIQHADLKPENLSSSFWGNMGLGILLYAAMYIAAPHIALFYKEPSLTLLLRVGSLNFISDSLGAVHQGLIEKQLRIKLVAQARIISTLISATVGITMAYLDYRVWSLVIQHCLYVFIPVVIFWLRGNWLPSFFFQWKYWKDILVFNFKFTFNNLNYFLNNYGADLMVGFFLGKNVLGYFSFSYKVYSTIHFIVLDTIGRVAYPVFSRYNQERGELLRWFFNITRYISYVALPVFAFAIILTPVVINTFARQWSNSIPVIQLLCASGIILIPQYLFNVFLLSLNRHLTIFWYNTINTASSLLLVYLCIPYGLVGIAAALVLKSILVLCVFLVMFKQKFAVDTINYLKTFFKPMLATACSVGVALSALLLEAQLGRLVYALLVVSGGVSYVLMVFLIDQEVTKQVKSVFLGKIPKSS
ncbi:MAG: lipopolysaccharide biosynthesis protein [Ferruginibacter sp.]|nr:lipopolysaccharide biosynthesis protein [Cytophagales bacterium]